VVPVVEGPATAERGNRSIKTVISAGNEDVDQVFAAEVAGGRSYNASEVQAGARVVALGSTVREELFPGQDPVGEEVTIEGQRFVVIGHTAPQGGALSGDQDNQVYMPYTTAQRLLGTRDVGIIIVKASDPEEVDVKSAQITRLLRPEFGDNVSVFSQEQTLALLSTILGTLTFMLAGIAGISLLVGGIGIMNIMLVSVTERTREIGIRKAVGARTYDILSQFVIEAVALSVAGGAVGILLGALGAWAIDSLVPTQITWWAVAMAFLFAAFVGIFFGVYPAWRASRLDPIEALRYE
jgi:putative ABC transport system permease protein